MGISPCPVIKIIGMRTPLCDSLCWRFRPLIPGNRTSRTRQLGTSGRLVPRNSAAGQNHFVCLTKIERQTQRGIGEGNRKRDGQGNGKRTEGTGKRSEEHTSELQSRGHLVCRLLLEKKKNIEKSSAHENDRPRNHYRCQRSQRKT